MCKSACACRIANIALNDAMSLPLRCESRPDGIFGKDKPSRHRDLNRSATNIPSACRIANIALNDAMILPYDANPGQMEFSERTDAS
jgi:hypothetical protein